MFHANDRRWWRFAPLTLLVLLAGCQPTPEERIGRAEAFAEEGDYRAAVIELKNALTKDPDNAQARLLLARSSYQLGDLGTAVSEYERALGQGETGEDVWLGFGRSLLQQGKATEIVERVLPNISEESTNVESLVFQGNVMAVLRNLDEAEKFYSRALELAPSDPEALVGMAGVVAGRGDNAAAAALVDKGIEENPDSAFAWRSKGNYERTQRNLEAAASGYSQSERLETPHTPFLNRFMTRVSHVGVLIDDKQHDAAAEQLSDLVRQGMQNPLLNYLRGRLAFSRGEYEAAQQRLQQYLADVPNDPRAHAVLGAVHFNQNNYRQAEMYLGQAAARNVGGDATRRLLAETQLRLKKPGEALISLGDFSGVSLDDPGMLIMLGRAELGLGNVSGAVDYLEQGVAADPDNPATGLALAAALISARDFDRALEVLGEVPEYEDPEFRREMLEIAAHVQNGDRAAAATVAEALLADNPDSANAHALVANFYKSAGDTGRARQLFEAAIGLDEQHVGSLFGLGELALNSGDRAAAENWFVKAIDVEVAYLPALVRVTQMFVTSGRYEQLVSRLDAAIAAEPNSLEAHVLYARAAIAAGRYAEALTVINNARESHPQAPLLDHAEGLSLYRSGQTELGLRKLTAAAAADPDTASLRRDLGKFRLAEGDYDGALQAIEDYRRSEPDDLAGLSIHCEALARDGKAATARAELAGFRARNGDSTELLVLAGDIEMYDGKPDVAIPHYEAAGKELGSRAVVLRLVRASVAAETPHAAEALADWLADNPEDREARRMYAQVLESGGDRTAAMRQYEQVIAQESADAVSLNNLAWHYMEEGRDGAVELAERAHELAPDDGNISDTLGWILYREGQLKRAEKLLRAATVQSPDNAEIKYHLAVVLAETGQNAKARSMLEELLGSEQAFPSREDAQELVQSLWS